VLLDAHCYIDQYRDPSSIAESCERLQIMTIAVTSLPSHYRIGIQHVGHLHYVKLALGFHPLAVAKHHEMDDFLRLAPSVAFINK
jgi:TatD DNase family protein